MKKNALGTTLILKALLPVLFTVILASISRADGVLKGDALVQESAPNQNFGANANLRVASNVNSSKENGQTSHEPRLQIILKGPEGDTGAHGPQGAQGPAGPQGAKVPVGPLGPLAPDSCGCVMITSLPFQIATSGKYCLNSNLSTSQTSGNAITITADSVVFDLNGFTITGAPAGPGTLANGILVSNRKSTTIRNGTVIGFLRGVYLQGFNSDSDWSMVENMRIQDATYEGIRAEGKGHIVRNNHVVNTRGNTINPFPGGSAAAIGAFGSRNMIINNDIVDTVATGKGNGFGIILNASAFSVVENNRIINTVGSTTPFGIYIGESTSVLAVGNRIIGAHVGIAYLGSATGSFRDNLALGCVTPYVGGTNAGNNQ